ncbi:unnamed protein product [Lymnaea stagnalis]|uniref:Telomere length regulation protein TEL2 homolog n=1 Tax=Lymnaea stagnalis TaxID=6523 RepID=A0AAV2I9C8_LYMST
MENSRLVGKEIINGLQTSASREDIIKWLTIVRAVLVPKILEFGTERLNLYGYDPARLLSFRQELISDYAIKFYDRIISKFSIEWLSLLTSDGFHTLVLPLFLEGPVKDSLFALNKATFGATSKDVKFNKCVLILEQFMVHERLAQLLIDLSTVSMDDQGASKSSQVLDVEAVILSQILPSFPENIANRLQRENSAQFLPQNYIPEIALAILDTLQWAHDLLASGHDVSLLFVSTLTGKLCLTGYADLLLDTLLPHLCVRVRTDFIWCRLCQRVFAGVPDRSLEAVVVPVLKKVSWYGLVDKFLGDCILHNTGIKMLICTKMLLYRSYAKPKTILHNIIGYLASFHTRRHLLIEVCKNLLGVWGDSSSMKRISAEQHLYISKALMACLGVMTEEERKKHHDGKYSFSEHLLHLLMPGVQAHLESSDPSMRMVGMIIAKILTQIVEPKGPQLEFELDMTDPLVIDLLSYKDLPSDPGPSEAEKQLFSATRSFAVLNLSSGAQLDHTLSLTCGVAYKYFSDDDLEPYDMSNDKTVTKHAPPKYVRECMEGLICSSEEPDRTELCLQHAEKLIKQKSSGLEEIAVEFTQILLHLEDTHSFENFLINRFSALVALAVHCPEKVAKYLTGLFYERNYSIRQRMDILEVLANAAQRLSEPDKPEKYDETKESKILDVSPNSEASNWREIVQRRIESNTRRFVHGPSRPQPVPTANRFNQVAGHFFYPLMNKADRNRSGLDLLGQDSALLFRLLYTLAIILYSAINLPCAPHMCQNLLDFTWSLRMHTDSSVRQAVLICTTTIFLVAPTHVLMTDLQSEITDTKEWLEEVLQHDPDKECQKLSAQGLMLLSDQIKKEVTIPP